MASIAVIVGGALVNALAFSGSNFIFSKMKSSNVDEERKRHDLAVEQLNSAKEAWSKKRTAHLDWVNEELRRENHAAQTFQNVEEANREYALAYPQKSLAPLDREPQLSDFYVPSEPQKDREIAFIVVGMGVVGLVGYYIQSRF